MSFQDFYGSWGKEYDKKWHDLEVCEEKHECQVVVQGPMCSSLCVGVNISRHGRWDDGERES